MDCNEILDSLLKGYEKGGHQDIEAYLKEKGRELGLSEEGMAKVEKASAVIDRMAASMESLQEAKEKGHSLKRWMMDRLENALSPLEDGEAKEQLVEKLTESVEKQMAKQMNTEE